MSTSPHPDFAQARSEIEALLAWYRERARNFLGFWAPEDLGSLDQDAERLGKLVDLPEDAVVCCLGSAGVGKSTLLNAVISDSGQVLPAGGIGPLTALAIRVHYSAAPTFEARYQPRKQLWRLTFALERALERSTGAADGAIAKAFSPEELSPDESLSDRVDEPSEERLDALIRQARQIVRGNQFVELGLPYLVDALRTAQGMAVRFGTDLEESDRERLQRVANALEVAAQGTVFRCQAEDNEVSFHAQLHDHAAGFLAPMIQRIDVGWPASILASGVVFVDLPGIGVASDAHAEVTRQYIAEDARAVVLVVDRAGLTEAAVGLLRSSGYWARLMASADDPEQDPCDLVVAVTKIDDVADQHWAQTRDLPRDQRPTKNAILLETISQVEEQIRVQAREQLAALDDAQASDAINEARASARQRLLENMQVFPVSAPEFRRLMERDDEDPARIAKAVSDTRIPEIRSAFGELGSRLRHRRLAAINSVCERLLRGMHFSLLQLRVKWEEEGRSKDEVERLTLLLEDVLTPLRLELANRRGSFREFLTETGRSRIAELVAEAREEAARDTRRWVRSLREVHWATLRAAVKRGGTFAGSRHLDLPADIADMFQEPISGVWGVKLLREIRKRTAEHASDQAGLVRQVADWAREQGERVDSRLISGLEQRIQDEADQLREVGTEATDELRKAVKQELHRRISGPIRKKCEDFVGRGGHQGPGTKSRILELFDELAEEATQSASVPARKILQDRFDEVKKQIDEAFKAWQDPLDAARDQLLQSQKRRAERADRVRRVEFSAGLDDLMKDSRAAPLLLVTQQDKAGSQAG